MNTRSTNRSADGSLNGSFDRSSSRSSSHNSSFNSRPSLRSNNSYSSSNNHRQGYNRDNNRNRTYQQNPRYIQRNQSYQNRYDNNQDRNRFNNRRQPNKYQHYRNQPKAQITLYTDQNLLKMMQMVRGFINFMKANPSNRELYKTNKMVTRREYGNEVNKSDIHSSNLDQLQQLINEDTDLVFDTLVAADYIDEIECTDGSNNQNA